MKRLALLALLCSTQAAAFKIDTHVWVGQQVIEDLKDGKLDFDVDGKTISIPVNDDTKALIVYNQNFYRAGNIGPDMSPDVFVGQSQIHTENKLDNTMWNTNSWLNFIDRVAESDTERAFALGFKAHAAADIFAHTYVNRYAGGAFDLADGETDVELRHILIESLISKYTPKGSYSSHISVPSTFIRDKIVYHPETQAQWNSPSGAHLYAINNLRENVEKLANSKLWHDLKVEAVKAIAQAQLNIKLNDATAEKVVKLGEEVNKAGNWSIDRAQDVKDSVSSLKKELSRGHEKLINEQLNAINNASDAIVKLHGDISSAQLKILELQNELASIPEKLYRKVKDEVCSGGLVGLMTCNTVWVDEFIGINPTYTLQKKLIKEQQNLVESFGSSVSKQVSDAKKASKDLHDIINSTIELENQLSNNLIDTLQQYNSASISPVEAFLKAWVENIDLATSRYIHNLNFAVVYSVSDKEWSQRLITQWVQCNSSALLGAPFYLTDTQCIVKDFLDEVLNKLGDIAPVVSPAAAIHKKIGELKRKATKEVVEVLIKKLTSDEMHQLFKQLQSDMGEVALQNAFKVDNSGKGLMITHDIVTRIKADMHVNGGNQFDVNRFAAIRNAVTLAKLSVLNHSELNALIAKFGLSSSSHYGRNFYYAGENILTSAVRSLDGNHQWQETAPQYVRRDGYQGVPTTERIFGYAHNHGREGFKLWEDDNARRSIFKRLFVGPLVPGIDAPHEVGLSPLKGIQHKLDTCSFAPFPTDENDKTCTAIRLIPAISMLF
ncbi:zinc dependent phospholipase C family protein [Pseudoalteromonas obscura]|uniref:Zinc dependent phospholipase C family protein n=1 Tax=Pseudoalteromonas obscura TaxID=3048491 RepID=A0ABT7EG54_9GAMM|nr:zinc dependent phospholipase C family protein [Pseudoalteromonas sp. P94(2023)]MDK2593867.1 zinc dependent phospholipase C family protein [Pseudoalteromonas sp. P94(2023)]